MSLDQIVRYACAFAFVGLVFSACIDFYLWFTWGYTVPSWTVSGFSLVFAVLFLVLGYLTTRAHS